MYKESKGAWTTGANHVVDYSVTDARNPLGPGSSAAPFGLQGNGFSYTRLPVNGRPVPFGFGWSNRPGGFFNSVHMALIPKGPNQGKVLVWDELPVVLQPQTALDPQNRRWFFQGWSIVDFTTPGGPTFENYLLPLAPLPAGAPPDPQLWNQSAVPPGPSLTVSDLFCAGHAWTADGNLVVAGGQTLPGGSTTFGGAQWLFVFDPSGTPQPFPGAAGPMYPSAVGRWQRQTPAPNLGEPANAGLAWDRFYPTVTITQVITRTNINKPMAYVSGGTQENSYESFVIATAGTLPLLTRDPDVLQAPLLGRPVSVIPGPNPAPTQTSYIPPTLPEAFGEYPRIFLLTDNKLFHAGSEPLSARMDLDLELYGSTPRTWDRTIGRSGGSGQDRHDGCCVFFQDLLGYRDVVMRIGGATSAGGTDTAEFCLASTPGFPWTTPPAPNQVATVPGGPRSHANAVILPDATVLVLGGDNGVSPLGNSTPVLTTALYSASGWTEVTAAPSPGVRSYHACALVLPDGRVVIGGGERSNPADNDYDIFEPHYLYEDPQRPLIWSIEVGHGPSLSQVVFTFPTAESDGTIPIVASATDFFACRLTCRNVNAPDAIANVVLLAPGSMTHHSDMSARYIQLVSQPVPGEPSQRLFAPPDGTPRGYYMLFALNSAGIPSVAKWVRIK